MDLGHLRKTALYLLLGNTDLFSIYHCLFQVPRLSLDTTVFFTYNLMETKGGKMRNPHMIIAALIIGLIGAHQNIHAIEIGIGVDYLVPADHRLEQGVGYDFYMMFDYNDYLSYGIMFRQLSISGEENDRTVVLDASEHLFSLWYEVFELVYLRAAVGGSKVLVSAGSGTSGATILSELALGLEKANRRGELTSKFYTEVGYRLRPCNQDYFGTGDPVTDLGGVIAKAGVAIGF